MPFGLCLRLLCVTAAAITVATASFAAVRGNTQESPKTETARAEAVVMRVCGNCHEWERIGDSRRTRTQWEDLIADMIGRGASGSDDDYDAILSYALRGYGLVYINKAPASEIAIVLGLVPEEADAIVAYRTANGRIPDFESLKKIPDVDQKKLDTARLSILYN
jgi:competence protein ComEA